MLNDKHFKYKYAPKTLAVSKKSNWVEKTILVIIKLGLF